MALSDGAEGSAGPEDVLGLVMLAFEGLELPDAFAERLRARPAAGVTLFRFLNVDTPEQVRQLTDALQHAARERDPGDPPLLVAADQEGGQFQALGDLTTSFAGAMALGATGDADLARRVGTAVATELAAMGVNVSYAPVADLATNPANPAIGIRSFGDDPVRVAPLVAAYVDGVRSAGVAATAKHFPGLGGVAVDSHHVLPVLHRDVVDLAASELVPFRAAIEASVDLIMSAHIALPDVTGEDRLPATLSPRVMTDLLRRGLGFAGVSITDALDMRALGVAGGGPEQALAALHAGVDLLLTAPDAAARIAIEGALLDAAASGQLLATVIAESLRRIGRLRRGLVGPQPSLDVVGSAAHLALARELAERSITLVRDDAGMLPLRLPPGARIVAIMPAPLDLTPADTSSTVVPQLAQAIRRHWPDVRELVTGHPPTDDDISTARSLAGEVDLVVVGTISASMDQRQVALVEAVLATGVPTVTVALRAPFDLAAYPRAVTHLCGYGVLRPSLDALADVLFGVISPSGHLPATISGLYETGHGLTW